MKKFFFYSFLVICGYGLHLLLEAFVVSNLLAWAGFNIVLV